MAGKNLLIIISDEHRRDAMGCSGHPIVKTPHLDALAARGTRFTNAYTPCPMCVPARAALHTGQYVHQLGTWSSAEPYEGQARSWAHELRDAGHRVASIGKLHFRDQHERNGWSEEILPTHILNGVGWTAGLLRGDGEMPSNDQWSREFAEQVGRGESSYTKYDADVTKAAVEWIGERSAETTSKPWVAFVSLLCPHYPLLAPAQFYDLYEGVEMDRAIGHGKQPSHPAMQAFAEQFNYDTFFKDDAHKLEARRCYYGMTSYLDDNIGQILAALNQNGFTDSTNIIYTSDHGELLGDHGQWTKMSMYEASAGVPLIMAGPDVPMGVCNEAVNLVDLHPTILENAEIENVAAPHPHNKSFFESIANPDADRVAISEFHDGGMRHGYFMLRWRQYKYIYYPEFEQPQLFDLGSDPQELVDLGEHPQYADVRDECEKRLREFVDPDAVNAQAHADQKQAVERLGGRQAVLDSAGEFGFTPAGS